MEKTFINRTITNNPFLMASVEIIIPFHNEHNRVVKSIESIFRTIHNNCYLISLVDDGSKNKKFIKQIENKKMPGVRCFQQEKKGLSSAINLVLNNPFKKKIPWVLILQPSLYPEDNNWLSEMGKMIEKEKVNGVKMVGPMTNDPNSVAFCKKGENKENKILDEGFLSLSCVLCHRELFQRIGDFEDSAELFALKMKSKGYKQAICGSSWLLNQK